MPRKTKASNLKLMIDVVNYLNENRGCSIPEFTKWFGFKSEKASITYLNKLMMSGKPPFDPSDMFEVEITRANKKTGRPSQIHLISDQGLAPKRQLLLHHYFAIEQAIEAKAKDWETQKFKQNILKSLREASGLGPSIDSTTSGSSPLAQLAEKIRDWITSGTAIQFNYQKSNLISDQPESTSETRKIVPLYIFHSNGYDYLHGYDLAPKDFRNFRIDRILDVKSLAKKIEIPKNQIKKAGNSPVQTASNNPFSTLSQKSHYCMLMVSASHDKYAKRHFSAIPPAKIQKLAQEILSTKREKHPNRFKSIAENHSLRVVEFSWLPTLADTLLPILPYCKIVGFISATESSSSHFGENLEMAEMFKAWIAQTTAKLNKFLN